MSRSRRRFAWVVGATLPLAGVAATYQSHIFLPVAVVYAVTATRLRLPKSLGAPILVLLAYVAALTLVRPHANMQPVVVPLANMVVLAVVGCEVLGRHHQREFRAGMVAGVCASSAVALAQFVGVVGASYGPLLSDITDSQYRYGGLSYHANQLGLYSAVALVVLVMDPRLSRSRFGWVLWLLPVGGLAVASSRTAFVVLGVGVVASSLLMGRPRLRLAALTPRRVLLGACIALTTFAALEATDWFIVDRFLTDRGNTGDQLRGEFLQSAATDFWKNPLFGVGFPDRLYHSFPASVLAGIGIVGFGLWTFLIVRFTTRFGGRSAFVNPLFWGTICGLLFTQEAHLALLYTLGLLSARSSVIEQRRRPTAAARTSP